MAQQTKNSETPGIGSKELFASREWETLKRAIMGARRIVLNYENINPDLCNGVEVDPDIENKENRLEGAK